MEADIPKTPVAFVRYVSRPHAKWALGGFLCVTLAQGLSSSLPYAYKLIIDSAQAAVAGSTDVARVWFWGTMYIAAVAVSLAAWRTGGFLGMRWIAGLNATAYNTLFAYVIKHSHGYFSNRFAGSLSSQLGHASNGAHSFAEALLWNYYTTFLSLSLTVLFMALVSPIAAWLFLGLIAILVPLNIFLSKRRRPHVVAYSRSATAVTGNAIDAITNIAAVRQFVRQEKEKVAFAEKVEAMRAGDIRQWGMSEWILSYNNIIITLFQGAMLYVVLHLWSAGRVSLGDLVMIFALLMNVMGTLVFIGNSMNGFIRRYGEIQEGLDDILIPYEITDTPNTKKLRASAGKIEFQHVRFLYDGVQEVFADLSVTIRSGERVGLVGTSGAGKSTFVSLLLRQHELSGGAILIDGQAIHEVTQDSLRSAMAVVPQEPLLFHRSIRDNIAYGKANATDAEIERVAKMAQAHDFIRVLPQGYDTLVGERGVKLSGGQRQRVAIARAMLKSAPILILDEATSSLDSESEVAVQKALHTLMEKKTVIAIAHRLSTLREMDRILVLEKGAVIEDGSHAELIAQEGGIYASLWAHQAGGFIPEE